ncbi:MAG: ABC transporter ATP-binding protein [Vulcanimicrobiaceae bacterium]
MQSALQTRDITKSFAGFTALDRLSIDIRHGSVHAVIGPNGAGKTTLMNVFSGFARPDSGSVRFEGRDITHVDPASIARLGIVRSFQISSVFTQLSALDNVKIALQARTNLSSRLLAPASATEMFDDSAMSALEIVGLAADRSTHAAELPYGKKRALELAIAIAQEPRVLLLDEPTAGMTVEDVERTVELIGRLAAGRTIVLVEHNLRVVEHLCERVTVLQRGTVLAEGTYEEVRNDTRVIDAYLGGVKA